MIDIFHGGTKNTIVRCEFKIVREKVIFVTNSQLLEKSRNYLLIFYSMSETSFHTNVPSFLLWTWWLIMQWNHILAGLLIAGDIQNIIYIRSIHWEYDLVKMWLYLPVCSEIQSFQ